MPRKRFRKTSLAAMLAAAPVVAVAPARAHAQEQTGAQQSAGSPVAALNDIVAQTKALEKATVQLVRAVNASESLDEAGQQALQRALNRYNVEVARLRNLLRSNSAVRKTLDEGKIDIRDVVAATVSEKGEVIVFYRPRA